MQKIEVFGLSKSTLWSSAKLSMSESVNGEARKGDLNIVVFRADFIGLIILKRKVFA